MQLRQLLAVPLAIVLFATGCSKAATTEESNTAALPAAELNPNGRDNLASGGELRLAVDEFGSFNPMGESANAELAHLQKSFLPTFFRYDEHGEATPNPDFLQSATKTATNPTRAQLKLNPSAQWADGEPITAEDVIATWRACNGQSTDFRCSPDLELDRIAEVRQGATETDVELIFTEAFPSWPAIFDRVSVLRAESVTDPATFNDGWGAIKREWTAGPFIVPAHNPSVPAIAALPNPEWWGEEPLLDRITLREVPRENQVKAYADAEIDAVDIGTSVEFFDAVRTVPEHAIRRAAAPVSRHLIFNTTGSSPANETPVRQAIAVGLDRSGVGTAAHPGIAFEAAPLGNRIFVNGQSGYADNAERLGFARNPGKARKLLDDAGWRETDGIRMRDGRPLEVRLAHVEGLATSEGEARAISEQLQQIGVTTRITAVSLADFDNGSVLSGGAFDLMVIGVEGGRDPYGSLEARYGSGADANYSRLEAPEVDGLIEDVRTASSAEERHRLANELDAKLWELMPTTPLYQLPQSVATRIRLANFGAPGMSSVVWEDIGYAKPA